MYHHKQSTTNLRTDERGFASLIIGLILVVVLGLLTVGFAQLTRHAEQRALSKQLATQAYYAAETGINDVVKVMGDSLKTTNALPNWLTSQADTGNCVNMSPDNSVIDSFGDVKYTCVLINLKTDSLHYEMGAGQGQSVVTSINPLSSLTIKWSSNTGSIGYPTSLAKGFGTTKSWQTGDFGPVLQVSITPLSAMDRASLLSRTYSAFLYPSRQLAGDPNSANYSPGTTPVLSGYCNPALTTYNCSATINNLPGGGQYLIHFLSQYDGSTVQVVGNGGSAIFTGGQVEVDVTGKARNVLKRLQVRVPISTGNDSANYVLEAQNICKRMATQSGSTVFYGINGSIVTGTVDACATDPNLTTAPTSPSGSTGDAAIQGCQVGCSNDGNPQPGHYGWKKNFTNVSPASQSSRVSGCTWTVSGTALGSPQLLYTGACNYNEVTPKFDFHSILGINDASFPAYDKGCNSIHLTMKLVVSFNDGTPSATTTKNFNEPACLAGP